MPLFMDVHTIDGPVGMADVAQAHQADLETQGNYDVNYLQYWVDEGQGKIFCLVDAPDAEAAATVHREAHGLWPTRSTGSTRAREPAGSTSRPPRRRPSRAEGPARRRGTARRVDPEQSGVSGTQEDELIAHRHRPERSIARLAGHEGPLDPDPGRQEGGPERRPDGDLAGQPASEPGALAPHRPRDHARDEPT